MVSKTLSDIDIGNSAIISRITAIGGMRRRLQDLGFIEGNKVDSVNVSSLGDPTAYRVNDTIIALRKQDADTIFVEEVALNGTGR